VTDRGRCHDPARGLADRFHQRWLDWNPLAATLYGIPGYDDLVPDDSEEGAQAWRAGVGAADLGQITPADAVTLDCTKEAATQELAIIDRARHSTLDPQILASSRASSACAGQQAFISLQRFPVVCRDACPLLYPGAVLPDVCGRSALALP
jgi:hypothetical protein